MWSMYGDSAVMRRRVDQLREQGADLRGTADLLVGQSDQVAWRGRAAESMRERVRERASHLRECASRHESAADSLEAHLQEVDALKDSIAQVERRAQRLVTDARTRIARVTADAADGVHREPGQEDVVLAGFAPPPPGHRDWLTLELPGL